MKKQAVVIMDQSQKSSDRERTVLQQAQEALKLKETATTEAFLRATNREEYMLDLLTDASLDMVGKLRLLTLFVYPYVPCSRLIVPFDMVRLLFGRWCRRSSC
jgi:hypothetical protein